MSIDLSLSHLWSWSHLRDWSWPTWRTSLDPCWILFQFAYRANRSVNDAVNMWLHYILQHLNRPGNYARILFVNFSLAFYTIMPDLLSDKLTQLSVPSLNLLVDYQLSRSALAPLRDVFSPHCSSHCTWMTALQRTPLSSSWCLQMTLQSSASSGQWWVCISKLGWTAGCQVQSQ